MRRGKKLRTGVAIAKAATKVTKAREVNMFLSLSREGLIEIEQWESVLYSLLSLFPLSIYEARKRESERK